MSAQIVCSLISYLVLCRTTCGRTVFFVCFAVYTGPSVFEGKLLPTPNRKNADSSYSVRPRVGYSNLIQSPRETTADIAQHQRSSFHNSNRSAAHPHPMAQQHRTLLQNISKAKHAPPSFRTTRSGYITEIIQSITIPTATSGTASILTQASTESTAPTTSKPLLLAGVRLSCR